MQRILTILCIGSLLLFTHPKAHAQEQLPEKKNLIGAGLSFSTSTSGVKPNGDDFRTTTISTNITYAHYIKKNIALGVMAAFSQLSRPIYDGSINDYTDLTVRYYSFSPFIRLDIPLWGSRFSIYNDLGLNGGRGTSQTRYPDSLNITVKSHNGDVGFFYNPGLMFRLKSNISLQLSYSNLVAYTYSWGNGMDGHSFGLLKDQKIGDLRLGANFLF